MSLGSALHVHRYPVHRGRQRKNGLESAGWRREDGGSPEDDVYFFDAEGDHFVLHAGQFAVFAPQDAHRPGLAVDGPTPVKKSGVKVAM